MVAIGVGQHVGAQQDDVGHRTGVEGVVETASAELGLAEHRGAVVVVHLEHLDRTPGEYSEGFEFGSDAPSQRSRRGSEDGSCHCCL